jgi:isopenicillin-N epimerase
VAERTGAQLVVAAVPFPIQSPDQVIAAVLEQVTPQTRLVLLDHVVSQTGLVLPIAPLITTLTQHGIETLIDGAHAPGMLPIDLQTLGATYYTGNCHKWLCAPKGAAFLHVQPDRQSAIRPLTISHGANSPRRDRSRFWLEFDWTGTSDPTAYLCVPESIRILGSLLPGGWAELMATNRALALTARKILCEALAVSPPCPDEMVGALATVSLPDGSYQALQDALLEQYQIEVPIVPYSAPPQRLVRISAQLYNQPDQYRYLAAALQELLSAVA